ncbi:hypothetical protein F5Y17DRAFT_408443 [Xylariaceae sp. FL0594]|nr:hypothetical protein F5Y17DRAFT_408443 [Xylariaceae sp. FL0594]
MLAALSPAWRRRQGTASALAAAAASTYIHHLRRDRPRRQSLSTYTSNYSTTWCISRRYSSVVGDGEKAKVKPLQTPRTTSAEEAAAEMIKGKAMTQTQTQTLDVNQLWKLGVTLAPALGGKVKRPDLGTEVPPGHHLVYFTPSDAESSLGADGSDVGFNAPFPFTRRMWAGGRMRWLDDVVLRVGDEVQERTRLVSAVPKRSGRDGTKMVLVSVEKEFWMPRGLALVDERSWIFRPEAAGASPAAERALRDSVISGPSTMEDIPQDGAGYPKRRLRWSPTGLFRFSALTFNGHKIHYDPTWSTSVEGHPACVVHGPLNLINMLDYWRDHCSGSGKGKVKEISYRAIAPIYAGEVYDISARAVQRGEGPPKRWEVLVQKGGETCMRGEIVGA